MEPLDEIEKQRDASDGICEEIGDLSLGDQDNLDQKEDHQHYSSVKPKRIRHRKALPLPEPHILPELFSDETIVAALCGGGHFYSHSLPLTCGLVVKARAAFQRAYRRSECRFPRVKEGDRPKQFYNVILSFLVKEEDLSSEDCWSSMVSFSNNLQTHQVLDVDRPIEICTDGSSRLWLVAEELTLKMINLSVPLQKDMSNHPLYPLHPVTNHLQFHHSFLTDVRTYHDTVRRPNGTFKIEKDEILEKLCEVERVTCESCLGKRQIYCGPCGGRRMVHSDEFLPLRVNMPFDVLLLLHYQESLVKCTGIHTGALCAEGSVSYVNWLKSSEDWQQIIESLDPTRDVILFPYPNSTLAEEFPWSKCSYIAPISVEEDHNKKGSAFVEVCNSSIPYNKSNRWRLVVLEASWGYAKTMAQQIVEHRVSKNLLPIPSVILTNVTGQYWRFQAEGHAAVSTIEAIAHTAHSAGLDSKSVKDLLVLFELQKYRVLNNSEKRGCKAPRAITVEGVGLGDWKKVDSIDDK